MLRQAAACLVHHGIRCAHLYLAQCQSELPGLLPRGLKAAWELRAANQQASPGLTALLLPPLREPMSPIDPPRGADKVHAALPSCAPVCLQVEGGRLEDTPKHAALQRVLGSIAALSPVGRV